MATNILGDLANRICKFFYDFDYYEFMDYGITVESCMNDIITDAEGTYECIAKVAAECIENDYDEYFYDEALQILMRMHEVLNVA